MAGKYIDESGRKCRKDCLEGRERSALQILYVIISQFVFKYCGVRFRNMNDLCSVKSVKSL